MTIELSITFGAAPGRPGLYPEGAWSAGRDYRRDAVVSHGNLIWRAKQLTQQEPVVGCSDWDQWLDYRGLGQASAEAQAAAASAQQAGDEATAARASANASATSKNAAAAAAQIATDKAAAAGASADAAAASKNAAAASAQIATDKAAAAGASADAAATSKTGAATSAQQASDAQAGVAASAAVATSKALDATTAALQSQQIAAGLSAGSYALDGIDAQRTGAIISVPRGLYMSGGSLTTLASLLSVSSGPKWVMAPNGNYSQIAANTAAIDYLTGVAGLRVEGSSTNYWANSENSAVNTGGTATMAMSEANALFGAFRWCRATLNESSNNYAPFGGTSTAALTLAAGDVATFTFAVRKKATGTTPTAGIYASTGWPVAADVSGSVIYGPGLIAFGGSNWAISNVSETMPTIVRLTMRAAQACTIWPLLYFGNGCVAGDWIEIGMPQLERGLGSSYIPTGPSPVARAADIVSLSPALVSLLIAQNATIALRAGWIGNLSPPNDTGTVWTMFGSLTSGRAGRLYGHMASTSVTFTPSSGNGGKAVWAAAANSDVALCMAMSQGAGIKLANHQGAITLSTPAVDSWFYSMFTAADTQIGWGDGKAAWSPPANLLLRELVIWPAYGSDAGVVAQSRAFA